MLFEVFMPVSDEGHSLALLLMCKVDSDRIQSFHMQALRRILGIRWYDKVSNAVVNERTKLPDMPSLISDRRQSLFGHICRLPENTAAS